MCWVLFQLLVCSRCFGVGAEGDIALLPMADMLNHSANPHVALGKATAADDTNPNNASGLKEKKKKKKTSPPAAATATSLCSIAEADLPTFTSSSDNKQTLSNNDFVAASSFEGNRPGLVFGTGPQGLGYYLDSSLCKTGTGAAADSDASGSDGSEGTGFTLILAREVAAGEEVFSTYDKVHLTSFLFIDIHTSIYGGTSQSTNIVMQGPIVLLLYFCCKLLHSPFSIPSVCHRRARAQTFPGC